MIIHPSVDASFPIVSIYFIRYIYIYTFAEPIIQKKSTSTMYKCKYLNIYIYTYIHTYIHAYPFFFVTDTLQHMGFPSFSTIIFPDSPVTWHDVPVSPLGDRWIHLYNWRGKHEAYMCQGLNSLCWGYLWPWLQILFILFISKLMVIPPLIGILTMGI